MSNEDHKIPAIRMDQEMDVIARMVGRSIGTYVRPEDTPEVSNGVKHAAIAVFLYQFIGYANDQKEVAKTMKEVVDYFLQNDAEIEKMRS